MGVNLLPKFLLVMLTLLTASAFAYELQPAGRKGSPLRWGRTTVELAVSSSFDQAPNVKGRQDAFAAIERAARSWSRAAGVEIILTRSGEQSVSAPGPQGDGVSLITIAQTPENLILFAGANSQRPALTRIFFDKHSRIFEADIVLNPYFLTSTDGTIGSFDLESTMVHEMGHALGLGHSELPSASMNETSSRNGLYSLPFTLFRTLSRDDIAGIRALYGPAGNENDCCGSVAGKLTAKGVLSDRLSVWIETAEDGRVEAQTRAGQSGEFRLDGLPAGKYMVYARDPENSAGVHPVGEVSVVPGKTAQLNQTFRSKTASGKVSLVGFNGELASVAVSVNSGSAYKIFVAGKNPLDGLRFEASAPDISIETSVPETLDYADGLYVVTFIAEIGDKVGPGEYSLLVFRGEELVDILPGALTVETEKNPWIFRGL